ncbi:MAG: PAS domain S-box protein [bacterium]
MIFIRLIYNLSLLISISIVSSFFNNIDMGGNVLKKVYQGFLFGGVAIVGMLDPVVLSPGLIFDGRSVVLSLASFLFGTVTMTISSSMAILFRIHEGGIGTVTGVMVIASSAITGHLCRQVIKNKKQNPKVSDIYIMSIITHFLMILLMFSLPKGYSIETIKKIILPVMLIYPLASLLIGKIFIDSAKNLSTLKELKKSESTLQKIFDLLPIGLWFADKKGKLLKGNSTGVKIWGGEPLVGKDEYKIFKARRLPSMEPVREDDWALNRTIKNFITVKDELLEIDTFDGKKKIILNYTAPVLDDKNELLGAIVVNLDITENVKAEEQIRQNERILQATQRISKIGGWEWDVENGKMFWTEEVFRIHEIEEEERKKNAEDLISQSVKCYHQEDREKILAAFRKCVSEGTPYDMRFPFTTYAGNEKFVRTSAHAERRDGKIIKVIGNLMDITEQVKIEDALAKEKELLRATLQNIQDGVITTDIEGNIAIINKVAGRMIGRKLKDVLGKNISEVFDEKSEESRARMKSIVFEAIKEKKTMDLPEARILVSADKKEHLINQSCAPIIGKNSEPFGAVLVFSDITEKRKIDENIKRADKLTALGTLAGGIAHDFNNLLNGIFGYIELAKREASENLFAVKYLDSALETFTRANDLTRQILTFSKGGDPIKKTGSIEKVIRESVKMASSGSKITTEIKINGNLHPCEFDSNQMHQVFDNLIINAIQAMPLGGIIKIEAVNATGGEIKFKGEKRRDYVKISMTDTGEGIQQSAISQIFDPFFTTKPNGMGLGLAMVYSIIKKHGGYIDVESKIGEFTKFLIYLPASTVSDAMQVKNEPTMKINPCRVLIMDDEKTIIETTEKLLGKMGYEVITSSTGDEALGIVKRAVESGKEIDAAILDLTVPGGRGGAEIVNELKRISPKCILVASSGYSEDEVIAQPERFGFTDSIAKPYRISHLTDILSKCLNKKSSD